jgi:hypothetical protein
MAESNLNNRLSSGSGLKTDVDHLGNKRYFKLLTNSLILMTVCFAFFLISLPFIKFYAVIFLGVGVIGFLAASAFFLYKTSYSEETLNEKISD